MEKSKERKMFYGAKPHVFLYAKKLRENMTEAELKLWETLKKIKSQDYVFDRNTQ